MNGEAMDPAQEQQQNAGNTSHLPPPPTITPAIPPYVKLGLTIAYTVFYSLLFAFVYAQLWLVLRYRHKRFSYQTAFLFLCLLWAALRALLFSFYFRDCVTANALGPFAFWLLYCFPVCLQFFTLSLMNLYCAQVYFKAKSKYAPALLKYRLPLYLVFLCVSLIFLVVNLICALMVKMTAADVKTIVLVRVTVNDSLFVLCAISLSVCLYKVAKMSLANIYLESKTINSFDYDWYNVSDQADLRSSLGDAGYIVFGVILFVWELLPTSLVVFFFRVRRPPQDRVSAPDQRLQLVRSQFYLLMQHLKCKQTNKHFVCLFRAPETLKWPSNETTVVHRPLQFETPALQVSTQHSSSLCVLNFWSPSRSPQTVPENHVFGCKHKHLNLTMLDFSHGYNVAASRGMNMML
uniref:G protein-coupled receptor 137Bb n=1 Tax=Neolamprologus brichardi TaxID=32507 RepID=A0A3Q4H1R8_NEOBR